MDNLTPAFLISKPTLVRPAAPWCVALDNLELGILLLTQPWIAGPGLKRSDLEHQLADMANELPIGPTYFQRINRAVATLEKNGAIKGVGSGRKRRFLLTPEGFASLILNLSVLRTDPTIDGKEFEFKRELVAMWNLMLNQLLESLPEIQPAPGMSKFFAAVDSLTVLEHPVITPDVVRNVFNVLGLVDLQRKHVLAYKKKAESQLVEARALADQLRTAVLPKFDIDKLGDKASVLKNNPELLEMVRDLAMGVMPQLSIKSRIARYDSYLKYLDELMKMYTRELKVVDIDLFRRRVDGRGA